MISNVEVAFLLGDLQPLPKGGLGVARPLERAVCLPQLQIRRRVVRLELEDRLELLRRLLVLSRLRVKLA